MNEELWEAVSNFVESCHRTDHHDMEDNIDYFLKENDDMDLDIAEVRKAFVAADYTPKS